MDNPIRSQQHEHDTAFKAHRHVGPHGLPYRARLLAIQPGKRTGRELLAHGLKLASNQVRYSLLDRRIETNGILDSARELGISIIAYSPLAQGILSGKFHDDHGLIRKRGGFRKYMSAFKEKGLAKSRPVIEALRELAEKYQATPSQVALNWLLAFPGEIVVAIPGATKARHAQENAGTMSFRLTPDELAQLDGILAIFKT